jgi:hypothetical protein
MCKELKSKIVDAADAHASHVEISLQLEKLWKAPLASRR